MKKMLSCLIMFALYFHALCPISVGAANFNDYSLYEEILQNINKRNAGNNAIYALFDMDMDGVDELIVKSGEGEVGFVCSFYTIIDDRVMKLGEIDGHHCTFFENEEGKGVIHHHGFQGSEEVTLITIRESSENKKTISTTLLSRKNLSEDEDYYHNSSPVQFCFTTDMSLLSLETTELTKEQKKFGFRFIKVYQKTTKTYPIIYKGDEIFFLGHDLSKITGYEYLVGERYATFTRGHKQITINLEQNTLIPYRKDSFWGSIKMENEVCYYDGIYYYPASQILPWMNVTCKEQGGILHIAADKVSTWDIIDDFNMDQFSFDFVECCEELGVDSKYLEAKSYLIDNGLMFIYDFIPVGWDCSYGSYMDYYDLFEDMFKDKDSIEYAVWELTQKADTINSHFDMMDCLKKFGDLSDLPDSVQALATFAEVFAALDVGADGAVYVSAMREGNKEKLAMMDSISLNGLAYEYPEPMVSAAMEIAKQYRNVWDGVEFKIVRALGDDVFGTLLKKNDIVDFLMTILGVVPEDRRDQAENITRVSKYETLASCSRYIYEADKYMTLRSSIRNKRCFAQLYLYACEQNWRTMAAYAQQKDNDILAKKYLDKAESTLDWQGKFLAASYSEENDSHEYGKGRMKENYTEKLLAMFKKLDISK